MWTGPLSSAQQQEERCGPRCRSGGGAPLPGTDADSSPKGQALLTGPPHPGAPTAQADTPLTPSRLFPGSARWVLPTLISHQ